MSQKQENDGETDAMAAIREAVEERQKAFGALDDGILDLDEVVWRSPARAIIDPTDTISCLAEEADKVAKGIEDVPPVAKNTQASRRTRLRNGGQETFFRRAWRQRRGQHQGACDGNARGAGQNRP